MPHMLVAAAMGLVQEGRLPEAPPMPRRIIAEQIPGPAGSHEVVEDGALKFTLFVPKGLQVARDVQLTIHFHTVDWHVIQEHSTRGLKGPLVVFNNGQGSSVYREPFLDKGRFSRWLQLTLERLRAKGWPADARVSAVDISSFSAGYGAVRELAKQSDALALLRRVVLCDSLYGSLEEGSPVRRPAKEHVEVWKPLAEAAARGQKTFVITVSEVPTETYAASLECARAIADALGLSVSPVEPSACAAARDPDFPLKARADKGHLHIWFYGGSDAQAHLTHARHLADVWKALDQAGRP
jgi:hypothetical protein